MPPLDPASSSVRATRVLVADQNAAVRASLRAFVESEPGFEFVGDASNADWLLWAVRVSDADLLVVDCSLPGGRLARIVECARHRRPEARIVMLGNGPWHAPTARAAGADAYVSKCEAPAVLRAALRGLADRQN